MSLKTSWLLFVLVAVPAAASAAPARVTRFEARVHAAPDPSSPVIYSYPENASISVSETATNGFRKVRLPDGTLGYIEESAIALTGAAGQPPGLPPGMPPPPPPYPGQPPPPGGYAPVPYGSVVLVDRTAFRHVGLFMRFDLGFGYSDSSTSSSRTFFSFDSLHGPGPGVAVAIGGAVKENVILAGEFWSSWVTWPTVTSNGRSIASGSLSTSLFGFGPNFTLFLMPGNMYLSFTPSLTWLTLGNAFSSYQTNTGFGARFALGKVWWTGPHWTLGVSAWFAPSYTPEGGGSSAKWRTLSGGIAFTSTVN
jgi:hypothetical protein